MAIYQFGTTEVSVAELKSNKDAVAAAIADLQSRGLTWADIVGLAALVARDAGDTAIADVLGASARQCAGIEEERADSPIGESVQAH